MPNAHEMLLFGRDRSRECVAHPVFDIALDATFHGATQLIDAFQTDVDIREKGTSNFVSSADFAAERAIVDSIRARFPEHAIISEESHSDRADSEHLWIIDPLDGTSNFLHSIPHFAVSIGYYHQGMGRVGIICSPITNDWYIAVKDQGAWHNGQRVQTSEAERLSQAMISVGFHYDRGNMMILTLETLRDLYRAEIHGMRRMGAAALDLAYVASGRFEAFFEYRLSPWDYAAGAILLSEAGGKITDCDGNPLPLGKSASVCATNGTLHSSLLERIAPYWNRLSSDASLS